LTPFAFRQTLSSDPSVLRRYFENIAIGISDRKAATIPQPTAAGIAINRQSSSLLSGANTPGKMTIRSVSAMGVQTLIQTRFENGALNDRSPIAKLETQIIRSHILLG
jgi:hypothetical protein